MERIPDWQLERYALGELPPERLAALRARLATDPELAARLDALRADDAAFLAAWPPRRVVPGLVARAEAGPRWGRVAWAAPVLAAAALLAVVARGPAEVGPTPEEGAALEAGRVKGVQPELRVYRSAAGEVERLAAGAAARAGDLVQVGYVAAGAGYGVVFSIDGNGVVTDHAVGADGAAVPLPRGGEDRLVNAYELDDAPRFERFFLVTSDAPFPYGPVRAAAERLAADPSAATAPLPLPPHLAQASFVVTKVPR